MEEGQKDTEHTSFRTFSTCSVQRAKVAGAASFVPRVFVHAGVCPCPQGPQARRADTSVDSAFYFRGSAAIGALRRVMMTEVVIVSYLSGRLSDRSQEARAARAGPGTQ